MDTVLLVTQIFIVLALVATILIQNTGSDGLAGLGGGGGSGALFSARGKANALTKATSFLAAAFMLNSLALGWLAFQNQKPTSLVEEYQKQEQPLPNAGAVEQEKVLPIVPEED